MGPTSLPNRADNLGSGRQPPGPGDPCGQRIGPRRTSDCSLSVRLRFAARQEKP